MPLSLRNPGAAAQFILLGTKGHKYVKTEMAVHKSIQRSFSCQKKSDTKEDVSGFMAGGVSQIIIF